ncbi:MAG: hypothetical protein ACFFCI_05770 [Promethearchaeota archaeon]
MSIILYKVKDRKYTEVKDRKFTSLEELKLQNDEIYIIIDKHMKRPKIWIWSGSNSNITDKYFAGVSATTIKSKKRLYGATIEVVESGNEPDQFPILKKENKFDSIKNANISLIEEKEITEQTKEDIGGVEDKSLLSTPTHQMKSSNEESKSKSLKTAEKVDFLNQQKVISLLKEISLNLEQIQKKIAIFLMDYKIKNHT